jgi:dephospho-CoA kinase
MSSETNRERFAGRGSKPVIGLIGAIGAGKSTAARCFAARGGFVIEADAIGHEALRQPEIIRRLVELWGDGIRKPDGSLDRRAIGAVVFADPAQRAALERLVFPFIGQRCRDEVLKAKANPEIPFIVLDAAVLLEAGWDGNVDHVVYVDAPRALRLTRLAARSGWTDAELNAREAAQWPPERKKARADMVIVNDSGTEQLQEQVDRVIAWLKSMPE